MKSVEIVFLSHAVYYHDVILLLGKLGSCVEPFTCRSQSTRHALLFGVFLAFPVPHPKTRGASRPLMVPSFLFRARE